MATIGFEPFEVESFINWTNTNDLKSKMQPLQSMNTMSSKQSTNDVGRPRKDVTDLQDGGAISREYEVE